MHGLLKRFLLERSSKWRTSSSRSTRNRRHRRAAYQGELLVQGTGSHAIGGHAQSPSAGITVIDGAGANPDARHVRGAHAFRVTNSKTLDAIQKMPHEEHTLWAAQWPSCTSTTAGPPASAAATPSRDSTA